MSPDFSSFQLQAVALAKSFDRLLGRPLLPDLSSEENLVHALYEAPFVLVAHGNQPDPVFWFANEKAQALWGYDWDAFTQLPSRLSAEQMEQSARDALLERARIHGFVDDYAGIRIAADGSRFQIHDVILWNITGADGSYIGQAACFDRYHFLTNANIVLQSRNDDGMVR